MVGLGGVEPPTSPLSGVRSNQLSYRPLLRVRPFQALAGYNLLQVLVELNGIEPMTS